MHQRQPAGNTQQLAERMAKLECRLRQMRRQRLRRIGGIALFSAVAVLLMVGAKRQEAKNDDVVTAKAFRVIDEKGRAVVEITAGELGGKIVLRSAASGEDIVRIEADDRGGAVRTFQNDGRRATELFTYQMTAANMVGGLNIYDWKGQATVSLGTGFRGDGPVSMGAHCPGGVLVLSHDDDGDDEGGDRGDRGDSQMMRVDLCLLRELAEVVGRD